MHVVRIVAMAVFGGALLLLVGAIIGGNFATRFELFGLRGYEATGLIGLFVGVAAGAALAARRSRTS